MFGYFSYNIKELNVQQKKQNAFNILFLDCSTELVEGNSTSKLFIIYIYYESKLKPCITTTITTGVKYRSL